MPMQLRPRRERVWGEPTPEEEFIDAVNSYYDYMSGVINEILRQLEVLKPIILRVAYLKITNDTYGLGQTARISDIKKQLSAVLSRYKEAINNLSNMAILYNTLSPRFKPLIEPVEIYSREIDDWIEVKLETLPATLSKHREKIEELEKLLG